MFFRQRTWVYYQTGFKMALYHLGINKIIRVITEKRFETRII